MESSKGFFRGSTLLLIFFAHGAYTIYIFKSFEISHDMQKYKQLYKCLEVLQTQTCTKANEKHWTANHVNFIAIKVTGIETLSVSLMETY